MRLFIPTIGTKITLFEPWDFRLFLEYRNKKVWEIVTNTNLRPYEEYASMSGRNRKIQVHLPKDTVLVVDRIYIRQKASDYDSVSFRISSCPIKKLEKKRFWAKLDDVNQMEIEVPVEDWIKSHDRVKK
jgi:hypothetical protein